MPLHDTSLCHPQLKPAAATLHILLDNRYTQARFTLAYTGVERFTSEPDPAGGFSSHGYGDLGYDEVDVSPTGALVHRVLFASGIELEVVFRGFELIETMAAQDGSRETSLGI